MKTALIVYILIFSTACNQAQINKHSDQQTSKPMPNAFKIPAMQLVAINVEPKPQTTTVNSNNDQLSVTYIGKAFPELYKATFTATYLKGYINLSKKVNGVSISKQLLDTPLKITHFALDTNNEVYIVTDQQKIYTFTP